MKLEGPFRLIVTGNTLDVKQGNHASPNGLWYLLGRLMTGDEAEVSAMNLAPWNLIVEDDSDGLATD